MRDFILPALVGLGFMLGSIYVSETGEIAEPEVFEPAPLWVAEKPADPPQDLVQVSFDDADGARDTAVGHSSEQVAPIAREGRSLTLFR